MSSLFSVSVRSAGFAMIAPRPTAAVAKTSSCAFRNAASVAAFTPFSSGWTSIVGGKSSRARLSCDCERHPISGTFRRSGAVRAGPPHIRSFVTELMAALDDDSSGIDTDDSAQSHRTDYNLAGLRKESARQTLRCHKKIGKASSRVEKARTEVERLSTDDDYATLERLDACPDIDAFSLELNALRDRLRKLNALEDQLSTPPWGKVKGTKELPADLLEQVRDLGVSDEPPERNIVKKTKKVKGVKDAPRKPYRRYFTEDTTEIRVGKQATDNDDLSLNPEHRSGSDWWAHASGCAGSHVVIRCGDSSLKDAVVKDAAALAARQSKCSGSTIKVSFTRCRHVSKPPGAKAGLVMLNGDVRTVAVNMKEAEKLLKRLDETVMVN